MSKDTIYREDAINAVLRNLNEEKYRSSWESGAVKVMKDTLEKMPTEDRPVNGVLFKGRLEEGNYNLIKTIDGWVLKGETSYAGFNFAYRPQGKWLLSDLQSQDDNDNGNYAYVCTNCNHTDIHAKTQKVPYCWWCGARMKGADDE